MKAHPPETHSDNLIRPPTMSGDGEIQSLKEEFERAKLLLDEQSRKLEEETCRRQKAEEALASTRAKVDMICSVSSLPESDLKCLSDHILASVVAMTRSSYGFYGFINEDESIMTIHSWSGDAMKNCSMPDKPTNFLIREAGIWAEAVRRRDTLILNDYTAPHAGKKGLPEGHVGLMNLLVIPTFTRDKMTSVTALANRTGGYSREDADQVTAFLNNIQTITNLKRAEEALHESEERLRFANKATNDVVWDWDILNDSQMWNESGTVVFGWTDIVETPQTADWWVERVHPDDRQRVHDSFFAVVDNPAADIWREEYRFRKADGEYAEVVDRGYVLRDAQGRAIRMIGAMLDITTRKRMETARLAFENGLHRAQKAESLTRMAGAIAHHFNNHLTVVMVNLEMALQDHPGDAALQKYLTHAMKAAHQSAEVSGLMLTYLGQGTRKTEPMDLCDACRKSLPMLLAVLPKKVSLQTNLPLPGPTVRANASQIQQVLTNLATNAWEAMGDAGGDIHLGIQILDGEQIPLSTRFPADWQPAKGTYACLEVKDEGCGIAESDLKEKLFDPFFSTRFTGRGMGLPAALGIVRAHHGGMTVESQVGVGSVFRVYLPLTREQVAPQAERKSKVDEIERFGAILLVEDETDLRQIGAEMLERLGFKVLQAKDGLEGIEVFRKHRDDIRLVISDLTMPRMDGWATLAALRQMASHIPVILASGYDESTVMAGDHPERPSAFLSKPYGLKSLRKAIARALGDQKDGG